MQSLKSERLETSPSYKITNKMTLAMSPSVGDYAFFHLEGGQAVAPRGTQQTVTVGPTSLKMLHMRETEWSLMLLCSLPHLFQS